MKNIDDLLEMLWKDYSSINEQAHGIHALIESRGEKIVNDHIAFRTFNIPQIGINALACVFVQNGYKPMGEYEFPEKKLFARHFEHADETKPKIFISELKLEQCSEGLQKIVHHLVSQVPDALTKKDEFVVSGVPWGRIMFSDYEKLLKESEYAAWVSVFGFRANHFTVLFNSLNSFKNFADFNSFLQNKGYKLNESGGVIKGSPKEYLEQSSTLAHPVQIQFADQKVMIPSCYYEFAYRYPMPNGKLFQGFVAQSANKIFESTNTNINPDVLPR
jgi:hypothetical protein